MRLKLAATAAEGPIPGYNNIFKDKYANENGKSTLLSEVEYYVGLWFPIDSLPRGNYQVYYKKFLELFAKVKGPQDMSCITLNFLQQLELNQNVLPAFLTAAPLWALESLNEKFGSGVILQYLQSYLKENEVLDSDAYPAECHGWQFELILLLNTKVAQTAAGKNFEHALKHLLEYFEKTYLKGRKLHQISKIEALEAVMEKQVEKARTEQVAESTPSHHRLRVAVATYLTENNKAVGVKDSALYKFKTLLQVGDLVGGVSFDQLELAALEDLKESGALGFVAQTDNSSFTKVVKDKLKSLEANKSSDPEQVNLLNVLVSVTEGLRQGATTFESSTDPSSRGGVAEQRTSVHGVTGYEAWLESVSIAAYSSHEHDSELEDPYHKLIRGLPVDRNEFIEGLNKVLKKLKKNEAEDLPEEFQNFESYLTYLQDRFGISRDKAESLPLAFPAVSQTGELLEWAVESQSPKLYSETSTPEQLFEQFLDAIMLSPEYKLFTKAHLNPEEIRFTNKDLRALFFHAQRASTVDLMQLVWFAGRTFDLHSLDIKISDLVWTNLHKIYLGSQIGQAEFEASSTAFKLLQRSLSKSQSEELAAYLTDILVNSSSYSKGLTNMAMNAAFLAKLVRLGDNPDIDLATELKTLRELDEFKFKFYIVEVLNNILELNDLSAASKILQRSLEKLKTKPTRVASNYTSKTSTPFDKVLQGGQGFACFLRSNQKLILVNPKTAKLSSVLVEDPRTFAAPLQTGADLVDPETDLLRTYLEWVDERLPTSVLSEQNLQSMAYQDRLQTQKIIAKDRADQRIAAFKGKKSYGSSSLRRSPQLLRRFSSIGSAAQAVEGVDLGIDESSLPQNPDVTAFTKAENERKAELETDPVLSVLIQELRVSPNDITEAFYDAFKKGLAQHSGREEEFLLAVSQILNVNKSRIGVYALILSEICKNQGDELARNRIREGRKLITPYKLEMGEIIADYEKYIPKNNLSGRALPADLYILSCEVLKQNYSRSQLKKLIAQYFSSAVTLEERILTAFVEVSNIAKSPQIIFDIFFLGKLNGYSWPDKLLQTIIKSLIRFRVYSAEIHIIINECVQNQNVRMTFDVIVPILEKLRENEQFTDLSLFFNKFKKSVEAKEYKINPSLSAAENNTALAQFSTDKSLLIRNLSSQFTSYLVSHKLLLTAETEFQLMMEKQWVNSLDDYVNGLKIYSTNVEKFAQIYNLFKENTSIERTPENLERIAEIFIENVANQKELFQDFVEHFVFQPNLIFKDSMTSKLIGSYDKIQDFDNVERLLQHLDKNTIAIRYSTKIKFYELFKKCLLEDQRNKLFAKLNFSLSGNKSDGSNRRKMAQQYESLKEQGDQLFTSQQTANPKGIKKKAGFVSPVKFPLKKLLSEDNKELIPTPDEFKTFRAKK